MPETDLHACQRDFARALRTPAEDATLLARLAGDPARRAAGIAAYRRNVLLNAHQALCLAYPVLAQAVGEEFMLALTRDYVSAHPSHSGDLNALGAALPAFLRPHPAAVELPWLADLAALEWAVHEAGMAADHPALACETLRERSPEALGRLRLGLQPALRLLDSRWPVASFWRQHQPGQTEALDLADLGGETARVWRAGRQVAVCPLDGPAAAFWRGACTGLPLRDLLAAAFALDPRFDAAACLQEAFASGLIVSLEESRS